MLRYNGMIFKMEDGNGITHNVRQVNRTTAMKVFNNGKDIWMHPCNMRVMNPWQQPYNVSQYNTNNSGTKVSGMSNTFEAIVNNFTFYNCDNIRGKKPIFFVQTD